MHSRADLIVVFGYQPSQRYPRFYERAIDQARDIGVVFVGCDPDPACQRASESILRDDDLFDTLTRWSALVEANRKPESLCGAQAKALAALTQRIHEAQYTAFVYEPASLPAPHAALAIEALHRIVKAINRTVRAGALALSGDDGALSVNQAVTWLSGLPLRTRVAYGMPLDHAPYRYRTHTLVANREIDTLLWISSFAPEPASLDENIPVIVLGHAQTTLAPRKGPTVFIPVATPVIDDGGHLFRIDSSVVACLAAACASTLPSVASVVTQLIARRPA
ncbi:Formylmethanofuran dehydrogenase subunit B [Candidatus Paraburkholderia calva]|nr:Formylmethanofuran dehydrogenase subunit B [Candidatus Paraburkholderia calva]